MATRKLVQRSLQLAIRNVHARFSKDLSNGPRLSDDFFSSGRHTVTMVPGIGTGPELMEYVHEIFEFIETPIDFEIITADKVRTEEEHEQYLQHVIASIRRTGVAIKGNIEMGELDDVKVSRSFQIRKQLDLYAMLSRCKSFPNVPAKHQNVDVSVVRENLEGFYSMLEHETVPGVVENLKVVTKKNSERIARFAFELARKEGKNKVTTVHKANIMKLSDGLFLQTAREVAEEYPEIKHEDMIIDNCSMQLVKNPCQFQVMLLPNLYGSMVSNALAGLTGGPGLMAGQNVGSNCTVFETMTRTSGTSIAGQNTANPTAILKAAANVLEHLGHSKDAYFIRRAIWLTLCEDLVHTPDLGGTATSRDVIDNIKSRISSGIDYVDEEKINLASYIK